MAVGTYYSDEYTDKYIDVPPTMVHTSKEGKTLTIIAKAATLTATGLDATSTFTMMRPPRGCRWNGYGKLWTDADLTNNVTLSVGTGATAYARSGDDVNYADATPVVAVPAAFLALTNHGGGAATMTELGLAAAADYVGYEFDGETNIIITSAVAAMATGVNVTLMMQFVEA